MIDIVLTLVVAVAVAVAVAAIIFYPPEWLLIACLHS